MVDEIGFRRPGSDEFYFRTKARTQPRRNVAQRDTDIDVMQHQFVQFQMPLIASEQDIRIDDEVVILSSPHNVANVGRSGMVVDLFNASFNIEYTVNAWFDLQLAKEEVDGEGLEGAPGENQ